MTGSTTANSPACCVGSRSTSAANPSSSSQVTPPRVSTTRQPPSRLVGTPSAYQLPRRAASKLWIAMSGSGACRIVSRNRRNAAP